MAWRIFSVFVIIMYTLALVVSGSINQLKSEKICTSKLTPLLFFALLRCYYFDYLSLFSFLCHVPSLLLI